MKILAANVYDGKQQTLTEKFDRDHVSLRGTEI